MEFRKISVFLFLISVSAYQVYAQNGTFGSENETQQLKPLYVERFNIDANAINNAAERNRRRNKNSNINGGR